ncbi:MAG: putative ATPase [Sulfitobacter sp.]|jgi:predicted ATPase
MSIATLDKSLDKTLEKLAKRMRDRMAVGGTSVAQTLEKGRGALPKHYRAKADRILEALQMANQPRLAQQIDVAGIDRAANDILGYLKTVSASRDRERRVFDVVLTILLNLAGVSILLVTFLAWKGLL